MAKYFKITNIDETHNNYSYVDGLNTLSDDFDELGTNGLYFTTVEYIPKYYYIGTNLREVIIPTDPDLQIIDYGNKFRANKIILGKKHSLFDPKTYEKFGLNMEYNIHLVNYASAHNNIDFLSKWKNNNWNLKYSSDAIDSASENGHIDILDWWKNSDLKMKYTERAIEWANECGQIGVLDWWFKNNSNIKCSPKSIQVAVKNGHQCIADWWDNLKMQYMRMTLSNSNVFNHQNSNSVDSINSIDNPIVGFFQWLKIMAVIVVGSLIIYVGFTF